MILNFFPSLSLKNNPLTLGGCCLDGLSGRAITSLQTQGQHQCCSARDPQRGTYQSFREQLFSRGREHCCRELKSDSRTYLCEIGTGLGTLPRLWAMMGRHLDHLLSETQAWKSHPAQPWPCFSSAQSFVRLWPGIRGPCALAGLTTMAPTAHCCPHPVLWDTAAPHFPKVVCVPEPPCLCSHGSSPPFTLITYILLDTIQMPNATSSKEPFVTAIP